MRISALISATAGRGASVEYAQRLWPDQAGGAWASRTTVGTTPPAFLPRCLVPPVMEPGVVVWERKHASTANVATRNPSGVALLASERPDRVGPSR